MRTVPLVDADASCGGKAATLGRLLRHGMPVPDGVVLTDLGGPPLDGEPLRDAVADALVRLGGGPVAVRSSGADEDGSTASWAGVLETVVGAGSPDAVADAVRTCVASLTGPRAEAYRARLGRPAPASASVLVQALVPADRAGVLFTRHPVTGADETVIAAARGLGESVVAGGVGADTVTVRGTHLEVVAGDQATRLDVRDGRLVRSPVAASDRTRPCLTPRLARELVSLGAAVGELLGGPQDVEWAVADERVWLLQARPVTAGPRGGDGNDIRPVADPRATRGALLGTGVPASPGVVTGPVRVVNGPGDPAGFGAGDVLVCATTSPAWTPLLAVAGAVVTETGGLLAHAAIVAREFGIPAVVSVTDATTRLVDGVLVRVDGRRGTIEAVPPQP